MIGFCLPTLVGYAQLLSEIVICCGDLGPSYTCDQGMWGKMIEGFLMVVVGGLEYISKRN